MTTPTTTATPVRSLADIEALETVPLAQRDLPRSTYEYLRRTAARYPQRIALRYIEHGERWLAQRDSAAGDGSVAVSYAQLLADIHRCANLFRALGVARDDVVSMVLPNVPAAHTVLWGGEACGIVNPVNYLLDAADIGAIVHSAGSRVLVIHGPHDDLDIWPKLPGILAAAPAVQQVLVVGDGPVDSAGLAPARVQDFAAALAAQRADALEFARDWQPADTASLFHTGGTTGLPKLARHSHGNEVYCAWAVNAVAGDAADVCYLTGLPLFHCNAAIGSGLSVLARGGTVLLAGINGFRSPGILANLYAIIAHYRVTNFNVVPTVVGVLTQLPCDPFDLSCVQFAVCGAAPMPESLFHRFQQHTGIRLLEGYGLTEATVCSALTPPAGDTPRIGSIGLRLPYTRLQAAVLGDGDTVARACAVDEVGLLLIGGPAVTPGYTDPARNSGLFVRDAAGELWLNTGDLGRQDADGYFWLTGREKELIIRGGHNIDPKGIEEVLAVHPAVNLVAALGRPDKHAGEVPVAYVDTRAATTPAELLAWCEARIGERAAIPKAIVILERLPVTGVGKIHKPTLGLMEIEHTVRAELARLGDAFARVQVDAALDARFGAVAKIGLPADTRDNLRATLARALADYSFRSELVALPAARGERDGVTE